MRVEWIVNEHLPGLNPVQFGSERCAPSHAFGPAVRTHWLLHYVISGQGRFTREGETHPVHAGNIFVIPPTWKPITRRTPKTPGTMCGSASPPTHVSPRPCGGPCSTTGRLGPSLRKCACAPSGTAAAARTSPGACGSS